jgi:hypothetical protein
MRIRIGAVEDQSDTSFELCVSSVSWRLTPVRFGSEDEFVGVNFSIKDECTGKAGSLDDSIAVNILS